ncbi:hypothetical protein OG863_08785 [Streptomyces decoyicus]|uniref:Uncharacterized protein n=1 Tax=Streptomyces decoyicus TaxID=249567 RepID=A0ABZ1FCY6_9ACTN|nr:hypothetical protein [Streptomyces decoyicus]WSB68046.1 hypothetical protein OG863_08785 [Streptomyces decoyicus]
MEEAVVEAVVVETGEDAVTMEATEDAVLAATGEAAADVDQESCFGSTALRHTRTSTVM